MQPVLLQRGDGRRLVWVTDRPQRDGADDIFAIGAARNGLARIDRGDAERPIVAWILQFEVAEVESGGDQQCQQKGDNADAAFPKWWCRPPAMP